jgi:hypothetical protein
MTGAIVSAPTQLARSQVIAELIGEIDESMARLYTHPDSGELVSPGHVTADVAAHRHRLGLIAQCEPCPAARQNVQLMPAVTAQPAEQEPPRSQSDSPAGDG